MRRLFLMAGAAAGAALLLASGTAADPPLDALTRQLEETRQEKEAAERAYREAIEELRRIQGRRQDAVGRLLQTRARLRLAESRVRRAQANLAESEARLNLLARKIAELEASLRNLRSRLAKRAQALFRVSRASQLELLLSAEDATDLALRARFLSALVQKNTDLIDFAVAENEALQGAREEAEAERKRRAENLAELEAARREVDAERMQLQREVNRLTAAQREAIRRRDAAQSVIRRAESRIEELEARIEALRNTLPTPLTWRRPVPGGRYVPDVDVGGGGVYLHAPLSTPVRAAAAGEVISVESVRGFGTTVILAHGGGFSSVYGNLASATVRSGDRVAAGGVLGRSGRSPFGEMLFFSIYKDGRAQDAAAALGL